MFLMKRVLGEVLSKVVYILVYIVILFIKENKREINKKGYCSDIIFFLDYSER